METLEPTMDLSEGSSRAKDGRKWSRMWSTICLLYMGPQLVILGAMLVEPDNETYYDWARQSGIVLRDVPELGLIVYLFIFLLNSINLTEVHKIGTTVAELLMERPEQFWAEHDREVRRYVEDKLIGGGQNVITESKRLLQRQHLAGLVEHSTLGHPQAKAIIWFIELGQTGQVLNKIRRAMAHAQQHIYYEPREFGFRHQKRSDYGQRMRRLYRMFVVAACGQIWFAFYHVYKTIGLSLKRRLENLTQSLDNEMTIPHEDAISILQMLMTIFLSAFWFAPIFSRHTINTLDMLLSIDEMKGDLKRLHQPMKEASQVEEAKFEFQLDRRALSELVKFHILLHHMLRWRSHAGRILDLFMSCMASILLIGLFVLWRSPDFVSSYFLITIVTYIIICGCQLFLCSVTLFRFRRMASWINFLLASSIHGRRQGFSRSMTPFVSRLWEKYIEHKDRLPALASVRLFRRFRVNNWFVAKCFILYTLVVIWIYRRRLGVEGLPSLVGMFTLLNILRYNPDGEVLLRYPVPRVRREQSSFRRCHDD